MQPYPSYKDSGVEWIGKIPSKWRLTKLKYSGNYVNGYPFKPSQWDTVGKPIIRIQNLTGSTETENKFNGNLDDKYLVKKGDLLFSWSTTIGIFEWTKGEGWLNQHIFKVYLFDQVKKRFFLYFSQPLIIYLESKVHGSTMTHLTKDNFGNNLHPLPSFKEQQQISKYLDQKTKPIDDLIDKTEQKIELLKEKRTSLINHCVTKGLDPNVEMKDSGVDWIGDIPKEWKIVPLRFLGGFQNGISKGSEYFGSGFPFMNYGDVYKNELTPKKVEGKIQSDEVERNRYSVSRGDVFFTRTSESTDDIGVSSVCLETIHECVFSGFVIRFRFDDNSHIPEYSRFQFQTHWKKVLIESKMNIVTRSSLSQQVLGQLPVLIPPLPGQQQIVTHLDEETKQIDTLMEKENKRIELLKEYRQSLISEVVTGKIDVRDEVLQ